MSGPDVFERVERDVLAALPGRAHDLSRLRAMAAQAGLATVTVVGKYNHGKSRLLNELMRHDAFAVADKRETVALGELVKDHVRWLDAPGLDADVGGADDGFARQAVWQQSDIRLFVHSARSGEFDAQERDLLQALRADAQATRRQTLLVVTQVDQLADDAEQRLVTDAIAAQAPGMAQHAVSSTRHRQGTDAGKKLLVEKSGIPALEVALQQAIRAVPAARAFESAYLLHAIRHDLQQSHAALQTQLKNLQHQQSAERQQFEHDLSAVLLNAPEDLADVLADPGPDLALRPDSVDDKFRATIGRLERGRVQVSYSRVCIRIKAVLVKHGAFDLPAAQHTVSASLNSAMVAVLGVSVKYRADLRKMFCQQAGRDRLLADFARYYELSVDRVALAAGVEEAGRNLAAVEKAQHVLAVLEPAA